MNTAKQTAFGDTMIRKGTSVGEVLFVILGTLYIWLSIFSAASGGTYTESYEVSSKRANVNLLTSLYETCSADLISREKTLDLYNEQSVNAYNVDVDKCEKTRLDQNSAVYEYNRLIGQ